MPVDYCSGSFRERATDEHRVAHRNRLYLSNLDICSDVWINYRNIPIAVVHQCCYDKGDPFVDL